MVRESDAEFPYETGGVLLGYFVGDEAVVTDIVGPGPKAVHGSMNFVPDYDFQASRIAALYEASGRLHFYIGDWHSHPAGALRLSGKDRKTLARIAKYKEARLTTPLMILLAGRERWELATWCCQRHRRFGALMAKISAIRVRIYP
jgi:integrative and conjugative element protein (TIGR02256 family)